MDKKFRTETKKEPSFFLKANSKIRSKWSSKNSTKKEIFSSKNYFLRTFFQEIKSEKNKKIRPEKTLKKFKNALKKWTQIQPKNGLKFSQKKVQNAHKKKPKKDLKKGLKKVKKLIQNRAEFWAQIEWFFYSFMRVKNRIFIFLINSFWKFLFLKFAGMSLRYFPKKFSFLVPKIVLKNYQKQDQNSTKKWAENGAEIWLFLPSNYPLFLAAKGHFLAALNWQVLTN